MTSYDQDYGAPVRGSPSGHAPFGRVHRPIVSSWIESMRAYPPGRAWRELAKEIGIREDELVMLAANENALGPSPLGVAAAERALVEGHLYPDGGCHALKGAISKATNVPLDRIVVGNGSNELIELIVRTFVGPDESVVSPWPSFVVYRLSAQAHGRETLLAPLDRDRVNLALVASLVDERTKVVFIANPNNPTGTYVTKRELTTFLNRIPQSVLVVLDEAYAEYVVADDYPRGIEDFGDHPQVIVLRTFSKAFGLAGLRIGYGIMRKELADYIDRVRQPYNVNTIAQAAATAAIFDAEHVTKSRQMVRDGLLQLEAGFLALGISWVPSQANFILARFRTNVVALQNQLRARGILVRAMNAYGEPDAARITIGTHDMNARFLAELQSVLGAT